MRTYSCKVVRTDYRLDYIDNESELIKVLPFDTFDELTDFVEDYSGTIEVVDVMKCYHYDCSNFK